MNTKELYLQAIASLEQNIKGKMDTLTMLNIKYDGAPNAEASELQSEIEQMLEDTMALKMGQDLVE